MPTKPQGVEKEEVRGRGRPRGSKDPTKLRLKACPKTAKEKYKKWYSELGVVAIYGVDKYTVELLEYMWKDPSQEFIVCDPIEQHVANLTRKIGALPYSIYRYEATSHVGFVESGMYPLVVVSSKYIKELEKHPNPHGVTLLCLEDLA